jgi:hypothetical protein
MPEKFDPDLLRRLCELASTEQDSEKLLTLIKRINDLGDAKEAAKSHSAAAPDIKKSA